MKNIKINNLVVNSLPITIAKNKNPNAFPVIIATEENSIETSCPKLELEINPPTIARIISPITSSITAAPRITLDSIAFSLFNSDRTLAVIPTLVAVKVAPIVNAVRKRLDSDEIKPKSPNK